MEGSSTHLRCSVHIDLCALERNLGKLKYFLPNKRGYIALLSADAFGYGVEAVAVRLMLGGVDAFAVTNAIEGEKVREVGKGWRIIVMSSSLPTEEDSYFENDLTPVIASLEEIERFEKTAEKFGTSAKVHMRLPILGDSVPSIKDGIAMFDKILKSKYLSLEAFCLLGTGTGAPSEGAKADASFLDYAKQKLSKINKSVFIHHSDICDASGFSSDFDTALRAGLVLFGMVPQDNSILKGFVPEKALTYKTSISQIKYLPKGATVGYGRTYTLVKESKVALLSAGYGDGIPRESGGKMSVLIRGKRANVIGRVSMDQATVDVSDFDDIEVGDETIIIGESGKENISIEEYSSRLGITPAQALTSITKRVARFYKTLY